MHAPAGGAPAARALCASRGAPPDEFGLSPPIADGCVERVPAPSRWGCGIAPPDQNPRVMRVTNARDAAEIRTGLVLAEGFGGCRVRLLPL